MLCKRFNTCQEIGLCVNLEANLWTNGLERARKKQNLVALDPFQSICYCRSMELPAVSRMRALS
jgi:hypothetical protein